MKSRDERIRARTHSHGGIDRARRLALLVAGSAAIVLACQSGPPPTPLQLGEQAFLQKDYRLADERFAAAVTAQPDRKAAALHGRARVALVMRDPESSLRFYSECSKADAQYFRSAARPDYAITLLEVGKLRLSRKKVDAALSALRALQKVEPAQPGLDEALASALTASGRSYALHGHRKQALARFQEAMSLRPHAADAWVGAAEILLASGQKKQALALLTDARRHNPSDERVRALTVQAMGVY